VASKSIWAQKIICAGIAIHLGNHNDWEIGGRKNLDNARLLRIVWKAIGTDESNVGGKATFEEEG